MQPTRAVQRATKTIQIVMAGAGDPVRLGFVASLARPGGNITGVANQGDELLGKQIQMLHEAAPAAQRIAVLLNEQAAARRSGHRMKRRMTLRLLASLLATAGLAVRAQPGRVVRLGVVEYGAAPDSALTRSYLGALAAIGWREGTTLGVERRFASGHPERFADLLRELAAQPVDLVFAPGHDIAKVAKAAIAPTPVITVGSEDPVRSGLIGSFNQPGGSVTGVSFMSPELAGKRLELLKDMVPGLARVAVLWEPAHADTYYQQLGDVAATMGLRLQLVTMDSATDMERAFAEIARAKAQALFVVPSRLAGLQTRRIVDFALVARLPAMSAYESFAEAGGLIAYGADTGEALKRAAAQTDRILKGARPGDVPFELPTLFRLALNQKTAKALGPAIPAAIVLRADRVIE